MYVYIYIYKQSVNYYDSHTRNLSHINNNQSTASIISYCIIICIPIAAESLTYKAIMSPTRRSHVTHTTNSCQTRETVTSHICRTHVTHLKDSYRTCSKSHVTHMKELQVTYMGWLRLVGSLKL